MMKNSVKLGKGHLPSETFGFQWKEFLLSLKTMKNNGKNAIKLDDQEDRE